MRQGSWCEDDPFERAERATGDDFRRRLGSMSRTSSMITAWMRIIGSFGKPIIGGVAKLQKPPRGSITSAARFVSEL